MAHQAKAEQETPETRVVEVPAAETGNLNCWRIENAENGIRVTQDVRKILRTLKTMMIVLASGFWLPLFLPISEDALAFGARVALGFGGTAMSVLMFQLILPAYSKQVDTPVLCEIEQDRRLVRLPRLNLEFPIDGVIAVRIAQYEMQGDSNVGGDYHVQIITSGDTDERVAYSVFRSLDYRHDNKVAKALADAFGVEVYEEDFRR